MSGDKQLNLMRASEVGALPVVTIDGGEDVAEIKDVVYDGANHTLIGFTLNKRGWFSGRMKAVLAADDVEGIGPDAVMIASDTSITDSGGGAAGALDTPEEMFDVIGNTVVTSSGAVLGTVSDVIIETGADPKAVGYEVDTENGCVFVPSSAQMALSGENLIVPAEADQFVRNDLAGFGAAVGSFRDLISGGQS